MNRNMRIPNDALFVFFSLLIDYRLSCNQIGGRRNKFIYKKICRIADMIDSTSIGNYIVLDNFVNQSFRLAYNEKRMTNDPKRAFNDEGLYLQFPEHVNLLIERISYELKKGIDVSDSAYLFDKIMQNLEIKIIHEVDPLKIENDPTTRHRGSWLSHFEDCLRSLVLNIAFYQRSRLKSRNHRQTVKYAFNAINCSMRYCAYWRILRYYSSDDPHAIKDEKKVNEAENHYWEYRLPLKKLPKLIYKK